MPVGEAAYTPRFCSPRPSLRQGWHGDLTRATLQTGLSSLCRTAAAAAVARTGLTQAPGATGCSMVFAAFDGPSGHGCGDAAPSERINRKMRKMTSFIFRRAASVQKLFRHTFQPAGPLGDTAICPECPKLCYSKIWPQKKYSPSKKIYAGMRLQFPSTRSSRKATTHPSCG